MALKKDYIQASSEKVKSGTGGWKCPCCNPYGCHPVKMKPLARRRIRRNTKQKTSTLLFTQTDEELQ